MAWPLRTVTSLVWQDGRSWPWNGLPPAATKFGFVTSTSESAPAQGEMMPACWDGGCDGWVAVGWSPGGGSVATAGVSVAKFSCGR